MSRHGSTEAVPIGRCGNGIFGAFTLVAIDAPGHGGRIDVDGNGIAISFKGSIISVLGITNRAEINFFLYDGTYWMNGWFNGTV